MKLRHLVSGTFFVILILFAYLAVHLGAFKPVTFDMGEYGPFQLVYKNHLGAYHKIVPIIEEVEKWVKSQKEYCAISFGEYLDNPKAVEQERLRSHGGCVLKEPLKSLPEGYEQKEVPKQFYIRAQFDGSPAIGPYKVYMKAENLMKEKGLKPSGPVYEFYEVHGDQAMTTTYYFTTSLE